MITTYEVRSNGVLEAVFPATAKEAAEGFAAELRGIGAVNVLVVESTDRDSSAAALARGARSYDAE